MQTFEQRILQDFTEQELMKVYNLNNEAIELFDSNRITEAKETTKQLDNLIQKKIKQRVFTVDFRTKEGKNTMLQAKHAILEQARKEAI